MQKKGLQECQNGSLLTGVKNRLLKVVSTELLIHVLGFTENKFASKVRTVTTSLLQHRNVLQKYLWQDRQLLTQAMNLPSVKKCSAEEIT